MFKALFRGNFMMIGYVQEKISQRVVHTFVKDVTSASSQKYFWL